MPKRGRSSSVTTVTKRVRTTRKRRFGKKYRAKAISRLSLQGQPMQKVVKLRYTQNNGLNPSTGSTAVQVFRANSIYDPDYTGTGGQPSGHDQWALFYNHYVVLSAKITCIFTNMAVTGNPTVGIAIRDEGIPLGGKSYIENGHSRWGILGTSNSGRSQVKLSMNVNIRKFLNLKTFDDDAIGSTFGNNPAEGVYFHIFNYHGDSNMDSDPIYVETFVEYLVKLREPKTLAAS